MDPHSPTAQRFPLVARFRPPCLRLPERVHALTELADTATRQTDQALASAVYNRAALIASDIGLPDLAHTLCHQHATTYLHAAPLPAAAAIRALEPVVNLTRLQMRAGHPDKASRRLLHLYEAVDHGTATHFDDTTVPANLTRRPQDHREVRAWLWRVLLADGTRTLTATGRWKEALTYIEAHQGIGTRMLDGRQVAIITALTSGDTAHVTTLLKNTTTGEPWEKAVTTCLTALCSRETGPLSETDVNNLVTTYTQRQTEPGMTVFDVRLGLTALDIIGPDDHPAANKLAQDFLRRATEADDGYAAREILTHRLCPSLYTSPQILICRDLIHHCALGSGSLPSPLLNRLSRAVRESDRVIRVSLY